MNASPKDRMSLSFSKRRTDRSSAHRDCLVGAQPNRPRTTPSIGCIPCPPCDALNIERFGGMQPITAIDEY